MMKLSCGKGDWLGLEHIPMRSRIIEGTRIFEPRHSDAAHAAALTNRIVARTFEKSAGGLSPEEQRRIDAQKVAPATFRDEQGKVRVVYREVIIRFEPGTSRSKRKAILDKFKLKIRARNSFVADQVIVYDPRRIHLAERMIDLANRLTEVDEIAFAFPNFVSEFRRLGAQNVANGRWHLDVTETRKAWRYNRGEGITIAIIDDGVDIEHPNLRGNIRRHPDPNEPRDLYGRDFFIDPNDRLGADHFDPRPKIFVAPYDDYNINDIHGTCCAGVAAARGTRARVSGAAPRARILPVKIIHGDSTATDSRVADSIRYASHFADVLSCSWEGTKGPDMDAALKETRGGRNGRGAPIFVATGNENGRITYPATSPCAIAVGASTFKEKRAAYSNYGRRLSVVAPSGDVIVKPWRKPRRGMILSTDLSYPRRGFNVGTENAGGVDGLHYNKWTGTSSSTPLAAGIAALMLSANPSLTSEEVRNLLQETADKIGPKSSYKANGHSKEFGYGRINAFRAVRQAIVVRSKSQR
jgi:subtilisin family serine protease